MVVIALTVFVGLMLVAFFVSMFLYNHSLGGSLDHDALLPLDEETGRVASSKGAQS
jgi:hypothetical protein